MFFRCRLLRNFSCVQVRGEILPSIIREYSRMFSRRPIRVRNSDGSVLKPADIKKENFFEEYVKQNDNFKISSSKVDSSNPRKNDDCKQQTGRVPQYEKLNENDPRFTKILTLLKSRKQREKSGKILLEGKRLITDAIMAGLRLHTIYFSREETLSEIPFHMAGGVEIMKVMYKQLQLWSDLTTSPGVMGVFHRPNYDDLSLIIENPLPVTIVCDNVRDPGNMGSILRCAAAAGCHTVLLTKGCVDMWEQKVLRSACGAHFRMPVRNNIDWALLGNYLPKQSSVYLADNHNDMLKKCTETLVDHPVQNYVEVTDSGMRFKVDDGYRNEEELIQYRNITLPCVAYTDVNFAGKETVLVIGGETEGLSLQAKKLAYDWGGSKIYVPTEYCVESLNSAMAMAIIVFEMKRQHADSGDVC